MLAASLRVLRVELGRLLRARSAWLTLVLLSATSALGAFVAVGATALERGGTEDPMTSGKAWAPLVDGWRVGLVLAVLVLLAHGARSLAGDREAGVLRLAVTRSIPRSSTVLGRLLLAPILVLVLVCAAGLAAWSTAWALGDFGPLVEDGYEIYTAAELRAEVLRGVSAILPAMLAAYAFALLVSSLFANATLAVSCTLGSYLAFDLFKDFFGSLRPWIFATHVPTLADSSAWSELPGVMRGFSDAGYSVGLLRAAWLSPWPALAVFALGATVVIQRKPL